MKLFLSTDIPKLDAYTIEHEPVASIDLMERAATALAEAIKRRFGTERAIRVFAGPGGNGGDALAVARLLSAQGYTVSAYLFNTKGRLSADCSTNKERLAATPGVTFEEITTAFNPPALQPTDVVVDGLFGSGLDKPLAGGFAAVVKYINASPATVVSVDVPSGLMCEDNTYNTRAHIVRADLTLSLQLPKLAFFFAENEEFVGQWELLDIRLHPQALSTLHTDYECTLRADVASLLRPRHRFAHKGNFGHGLLVAGSEGMAGAAILAAQACIRSGIGKLTVHTPACNNPMLQTAVPEAMVQPDLYPTAFATPVDTDDYQSVAIGPGLGQAAETAQALVAQLGLCSAPVVLDADALNLLARSRDWQTLVPPGSILTPHPKELDRLTGASQNSWDRLNKARDLATRLQCHIVLKGAYTVVATPEGRCLFNSTGNPGMATAGSGDVLTGILLALLAGGYAPADAARLGVYVHGLAGDLAARQQGFISLSAGDIVRALPQAWMSLSPSSQNEPENPLNH